MSIRKVSFAPFEYYHIYNRGNSKQKIFNDKEDYLRFIFLLYISNSSASFNFYDLSRNNNFNVYEIEKNDSLVDIGAYCLMPNHFHLLLTQKNTEENNNITKFMQKL